MTSRLQVAPSGEVYLPLRRHRNIVVTAPRLADAEPAAQILNDDNVHIWLAGPPYPYLLEHGFDWFTKLTTQSSELLQQIERSDTGTAVPLDGCPVSSIREIKPDGSDVFIGAIEIIRCADMDLAYPEGAPTDKISLNLENDNKSPGDPSIVWTIGNYLAPSHHGRGIMSDAVETLMHDWAIPGMGARRFLATAFETNHGSVKVFLNNGYQLRPQLAKDYVQAKGKLHSLQVLDYSVN